MKILTLVLALVAFVTGSQWFLTHKELIAQRAETQKLKIQIVDLERHILTLDGELDEARKRSVDAIADDLNDTFIEGWGTMLEEIKKKLKQTTKTIQNEIERNNSEPEESAQPSASPAEERT